MGSEAGGTGLFLAGGTAGGTWPELDTSTTSELGEPKGVVTTAQCLTN